MSQRPARLSHTRLAPWLARLRGSPRRAWAPILVAVVGLAATAGFAHVVSRVVMAARVARFNDVVERAIATLDGRLASHQASVSAAAAVLGASSSVDTAEFERLVASLGTHRPAPVMVAWCERRPPLREGGTPTCPAVRIWSRAPASDASVDLAELGDLQAAMDRASSARSSALALIHWPRPNDETAIAFVFPVLGPAEFAERKPDAVRGFLVSAFSATEALSSALRASEASVDVEVRDSDAASDAPPLWQSGDRGYHSVFTYAHTLDVAGRRWQLAFSSTSRFDREGQRTLVLLIWIAGAFVTILLTALTWSEFRARTRAERIGEKLAEADEGLRRASRAKDEFLAMLGHELRNPLGAISNALKVMRLRRPTDPGLLRALAIAERQAVHQSRLVDDLLDLTRLGTGKFQLEPVLLDVRDVARRATSSVRPLLDERGHSLTLELPSEPTEIEADPTRCEQILVNLLTNAIKYTPPRGVIELSVRRDLAAGRVSISVRDNGVGIDAAALENVFAPFFQGTNAVPDQRGGLGIGLAIVRRLVELHGGSVSASSDGSGKGSSFEVRLPLCKKPAHAARPAREVEPAARAVPGAALDVLIVEDMSDNREMLAELVALAGHGVREAKTGAEALARVRERAPDLALVDLGLPDMDGLEVARQIRAMPGGDSVRLVAVTGFGSPEIRARALQSGFDQHAVKPLGVQFLMDLLQVKPNGDAARAG